MIIGLSIFVFIITIALSFIPCSIIIKFGSFNTAITGSLTIKVLRLILRRFWFHYNVGGRHKLFCNFKFPISKKKTDSPMIELDIGAILKKSQIIWDINMEIGLKDAALLSLITGLLRISLIQAASLSLSSIPWQSQSIRITPTYGKNELKTGFSCILKVHLGHIIIETTKSLIKSARKR